MPSMSVNSSMPSIVGLKRVIVAGWCRLRHQSTEKCTIGTSANAISPAMAQRRARTCGSVMTRRRAR